ncbi:hypothetical protein NHQ30_007570 [Ciborinia camelliae]|nr:hypothetical protein NHQ30_007570 [Ciborinia camelliae]
MALEADHDPERRLALETHIQGIAKKFLRLFDEYDVDVIIGPSDSGVHKFSAAGGFPIATLPISCIGFNGRPFWSHNRCAATQRGSVVESHACLGDYIPTQAGTEGIPLPRGDRLGHLNVSGLLFVIEQNSTIVMILSAQSLAGNYDIKQL